MRIRTHLAAVVLFLSLAACAANAEDWPQFRGPSGLGSSSEAGIPARWSAEENIVWKADLPGFGGSCPIVVGTRVFVTCYTGYGQDVEKPGREEDLARELLCFDRATGKKLWSRRVPAAQPEANYLDFLVLHGYATSTPACDGERVYVFFGKSGVYAYDLEGREQWHADVGSSFHYWGSAASPIVLGEHVIVNAAIEGQAVLALDRKTGKEIWRSKNLISSWSTPVPVETADGKQELVISVKGKLVALDPATGERRWSFKTNQSYAAPTPIAGKGVLYAVDARPSAVFAIRTGGEGDVTETHVVWRADGVGSGITSPARSGEYLFTVDDAGLAACVEVASGKVLAKKRLRADQSKFYASPIVADGKVIAVSREAGAFVLSADAELRELGVNRVDESLSNATPAAAGGQLFLHTNVALYCIGSKK